METHWEHMELIGNLKGTVGNKGKMKKMTHTLVSLGTKDRRTWCIHINIKPRVDLFGSCGFSV